MWNALRNRRQAFFISMTAFNRLLIGEERVTMIFGIGIDIIKVERMREVVERWGERFLRRVFTENEIAYCYEKKNPFLSLAVRFAAKEAFIKAAGSGMAVSLTDIEVLNNDNGRPSIAIKGKLLEVFGEKSVFGTHLSLSHEKEFGVACVVIDKEGTGD